MIKKGSGHFHVEHGAAKLAKVDYDPKNRYVEVGLNSTFIQAFMLGCCD